MALTSGFLAPPNERLRERCSGHLSYVGIGAIRIVPPERLWVSPVGRCDAAWCEMEAANRRRRK